MAKVNLYDARYKALTDIDWDFTDTPTDELESIHPYPARFIPEIPNSLIKTIGCKADTKVFDPFCGCGTTLVEAERLGIPSVGVDLNPIGCLISRVKIAPLPENYLSCAQVVISNAQKRDKVGIVIPQIPNLDHWFKKDIQTAIEAICEEINNIKDTTCQDALRLALSSIIVRVSNQESDTRYAAIDNNRTSEDVFHEFYKSCKHINDAKEHETFHQPATVIESDILKVKPEQIGKNIGIVITSPPYPNAYEYWLYHKYRMWWLGYDPINVRENEIGARPHYQKKNGQTEEDFKKQMQKVFSLINQVLIKDGHICIVVGRSIIKGQEIDNAKLIKNIAQEDGLELVADIQRVIAPSKKSFNLKYGKIKTENIVIFRKDH